LLQRVEAPRRLAAAPLVVTDGHICFWQGGSLWLGRGQGRSRRHDHHAHQVAISLDGTCRFRGTPEEPWSTYAAAIIPSHRKHEFEFEGAIAHLFVEPETPQGRSLDRYCSGPGISALPDAECCRIAPMLQGAAQAQLGGDALVRVGQAVLATLTGCEVMAAPVDPRVTKAIEYLGSRLLAPVSLADAAAAAALSPGRFRHLFVQETGTTFRAYLLWLRLNVAIGAAMDGASWTSAAYEAGFADSAHLTRTFVRMFGINPADLSSARNA
jgi:AraC family transcriptional regulator